MEIVRIFEDEDCLLAALYDDEEDDEFARLFETWTDIEKLERFFNQNSDDLERPYWEGISIDEAVLFVRKEALGLMKQFRELKDSSSSERLESFVRLFKPLDSCFSKRNLFERKKVYGKDHKSFLRIYALGIGSEMYLISGGAIKLTNNMQEREHTKKELVKLEKCRQFLKELGVVDEDGVIDLLEM